MGFVTLGDVAVIRSNGLFASQAVVATVDRVGGVSTILPGQCPSLISSAGEAQPDIRSKIAPWSVECTGQIQPDLLHSLPLPLEEFFPYCSLSDGASRLRVLARIVDETLRR